MDKVERVLIGDASAENRIMLRLNKLEEYMYA